MKYLLSLAAALLLLATSSFAAPGNPLSTTVRADGYSATIRVEGVAAGGTYAMGWSTYNTWSTSVPKIMFTATSDSYNRDGTTCRRTRTFPGTMEFRKPYPDQTLKQETPVGSDLDIVVALHEYVYPTDTLTVTMLGGWYTQGGTPTTAVTNAAVTNSSTASYSNSMVLASWTDVSFRRISDATFELRCFAYHGDAQAGRPVRAVHFKVSDGVTERTVITSTMVKDPLPGDALTFPEYVGTFTAADFAQGPLVGNFKAYPWFGDSTTVYDTASFASAPTYDSGPLSLYNDKTGAYGVSMCLVTTSGSDGSGQVYTAGTYNAATAAPFATHSGAAAACRTFNNSTYGRADVGASIIETDAGNYALLGPSGTFGTVPAVWLTIRAKTGVAASAVVFNTTSGASDISDRIHFQQVSFTVTTSGLNSCNAVFLDRCIVDSTSTDLFDGTCYTWAIGTNFKYLSQSLKAPTGTTGGFALVRGCDFTGGFAHNIITQMAIGCVKNDVTAVGSNFFRDTSGSGLRPQSNIIAYCEFYGVHGIAVKFNSVSVSQTAVRGTAILNCLFEATTGGVATPLVQINGSAAGENPIYNTHLANNIFIGQRAIFAYNSSGTLPAYYHNWTMHGNIQAEYNIKIDTFAPGDGARIGNWAPYHGVNYSGNVHSDAEGNDQFNNRFAGISTSQVNWGTTTSYFDFVDYQASPVPDTAGAGLGDYHIGTSSPAYQIAYKVPLPYDLAGNIRNLPDSAGVFTTYSGGSLPTEPSDPVTGTTINVGTLNPTTFNLTP